MKLSLSQRTADKAIQLIAGRMYRRHGIPTETGVQEAIAIALDRGDPVASVLADHARLLIIADGFGGGDGRRKVDRFTGEALALLAIANDRADAAFPQKPIKSPTAESEFDAWLRSKGARGPSRQRLLKETEQRGEARGHFAFRAVFLIGPDEGPVRIGVSKTPADQLRLVNRHCVLDSKLGFEGYAISSVKAQRIMTAVLEQAKNRGLLHPDKRKADTLMMPMMAAIEAVERARERLGIALVSKAEKMRAISDAMNREFAEDD